MLFIFSFYAIYFDVCIIIINTDKGRRITLMKYDQKRKKWGQIMNRIMTPIAWKLQKQQMFSNRLYLFLMRMYLMTSLPFLFRKKSFLKTDHFIYLYITVFLPILKTCELAQDMHRLLFQYKQKISPRGQTHVKMTDLVIWFQFSFAT